MKKFLTTILLVLCFCFNLGIVNFAPSIAFADEAQNSLTKEEIKTELSNFVEYGSTEKTRLDRSAGSTGEKLSAEYIKNELKTNSTLQPINNEYFLDGIQNFTFVTSNEGTLNSQNVGFVYKSTNENAKTLVLCTHYDNRPIYKTQVGSDGEVNVVSVAVEGVNSSAGSVAMLMALAKHISNNSMNFDYNIEFLFFGASSYNYVGASHYLRSINSRKDDYALILNFSKIAVGDYNYVYSQEFDCEYGNYLQEQLKTLGNFSTFSKVNNIETDDYGNYSHAGLESDNVIFIESGINVAHIFSGHYEGFSSIGKTESENFSQITGTQNDTIDGIEQIAKVDVASNLEIVANATLNLISGEDFISSVSVAYNLQSTYEFWNNEKLVLFILGIVMVIIFIIYYAIYDWLYKKSKMRMNDEELASVVMKIQSEVGEVGQEIKQNIKDKINDDVDK